MHHFDIEHTHGAFGIILGAGRGDDFYALHHRGWHRLGNLREIALEHLIRFTIDIDLKVGGAFHRDFVLSVDSDHRHLAEHVEERHRLGVGVLLHVVGHLVGSHLHYRLLCHDLNALQVERVFDILCLGRKRTEAQEDKR